MPGVERQPLKKLAVDESALLKLLHRWREGHLSTAWWNSSFLLSGDLRATHPHYVYTPHGAPQVLHNSGRLAWGSGPKGETPQYTGVDFIIARDGKIAALYVYLDSPPT